MILSKNRFKTFHARYMTMLELLIGMVLITMLLSMLTYFFQDLNLLNSEAERRQKEDFLMRYAENRLSAILPQIKAEHQLKENFYFFTSGDLNGLTASNSPSLVFVYGSGIDLDTHKSVRALGRLYVDSQKRLCVASWPAFEDWEDLEDNNPRREVLLEGVESIRFQFYVPPERDRSMILKDKKNPREQPKSKLKDKDKDKDKEIDKDNDQPDLETLEYDLPPNQWVSEWRREYKMLPAMIKVHLTLVKKENQSEDRSKMTFAFPFPNSKDLIIYEEG